VILLLVLILRTLKSLARPHFLCFYACTVASSIGTCILRHGKVGNFKLFQFHGAQTKVLKTFGNNNEQDLFYLSMRSQHNCFHGKWTCFEGAVTKTKLAQLRGWKFPICTVVGRLHRINSDCIHTKFATVYSTIHYQGN
jgi:hypothetical protein